MTRIFQHFNHNCDHTYRFFNTTCIPWKHALSIHFAYWGCSRRTQPGMRTASRLWRPEVLADQWSTSVGDRTDACMRCRICRKQCVDLHLRTDIQMNSLETSVQLCVAACGQVQRARHLAVGARVHRRVRPPQRLQRQLYEKRLCVRLGPLDAHDALRLRLVRVVAPQSLASTGSRIRVCAAIKSQAQPAPIACRSSTSLRMH